MKVHQINVGTLNFNEMIQGNSWQSNLFIWFVGVIAGGVNYTMELAITPDWIKFFHATLSAAFFGIVAVIAKQLYLLFYKKVFRPLSSNAWIIIIKKFKHEEKPKKEAPKVDDNPGK